MQALEYNKRTGKKNKGKAQKIHTATEKQTFQHTKIPWNHNIESHCVYIIYVYVYEYTYINVCICMNVNVYINSKCKVIK